MFEIKECAEIPHRTPTELMESLRECFRQGASIVQAAFAHSFFLHPEEVEVPPLYGDRARYSREHYPDKKKWESADWNGREVRLDDNSAAQGTWAKLSMHPLVRGSSYGVRHIWGEPWNPDMFTAGWNLCYMPSWAGMLTEQQHLYRDLREAVRQVAWELYFGSDGRLEVPDNLAAIVHNPERVEELCSHSMDGRFWFCAGSKRNAISDRCQ